MKQKYKVYINNETNIVTENWIDFVLILKSLAVLEDWFLMNKIKY